MKKIWLPTLILLLTFCSLTYANEGKKDGVHKEYYKSGALKSEINYKNVLYHGPIREYYESGVLKAEGHFERGKPTGIYKVYYENGNLQSEMNLAEGISKSYYENGNLQSEWITKEGKLISKKEYDKEGKPITKSGEVIAIVLGKEIVSSEIEPAAKQIQKNKEQMKKEEYENWLKSYRKSKITSLIFGTLLVEYNKEHDVEPTDEEIQAHVKWLNSSKRKTEIERAKRKEEILKELESPNLDEKMKKRISDKLALYERVQAQDKEIEEMRKRYHPSIKQQAELTVSKHVIKTWKRNKSLYEEYGGRVIFQQFGPEPLDAYRGFLEHHQEKGSFEIYAPSFKKLFWEYFVNDKMHSFYSEEEGKKIMTTPLWLLEDNKQ